MSRRVFAALVAGLFVPANVIVGCGGSTTGRLVSRANITPWPLTVASGTLLCHRRNTAGLSIPEVTFTTHDGSTYAVNSTALGDPTQHYRPIREIWAPDPSTPGLRMYIGPLITAGLKLCGTT